MPPLPKPKGADNVKKAIELVETREGCQIFEERPRYHVMFRGRKYGELHFNMTGYTSSTGCLPYPGPKPGVPVPSDIGEASISAYRREIACLNREWAEIDNKAGAAQTLACAIYHQTKENRWLLKPKRPTSN